MEKKNLLLALYCVQYLLTDNMKSDYNGLQLSRITLKNLHLFANGMEKLCRTISGPVDHRACNIVTSCENLFGGARGRCGDALSVRTLAKFVNRSNYI